MVKAVSTQNHITFSTVLTSVWQASREYMNPAIGATSDRCRTNVKKSRTVRRNLQEHYFCKAEQEPV